MMYDKWNKYKIGNVIFSNATKNHPARKFFANHVVESGFKSILEIGPGEMRDYNLVKDQPDIDYTVVDVSSVFLQNCRKKYPEVHTIESAVEDLQVSQKYDLVYALSVLEHSKDVRKAIERIMTTATHFMFTMFKWSYDDIELVSEYRKKKGYWSTSFGINRIFEHIQRFGKFDGLVISDKNAGMYHDFKEYSKGLTGNHRNGNYLTMFGTCNT